MKTDLTTLIKTEIGNVLNKKFVEDDIKRKFYKTHSKKEVDKAYKDAFEYWVDVYCK